jgi:cytochrome-b5 reductase
MEYNTKNLAVKQERSPLDPENFVNFKLKKIVPYNHNTSTCVQSLLYASFRLDLPSFC